MIHQKTMSDFDRAKEMERVRFAQEKREISKNYTIAPAYNKGAYQVIPKKDIKHIGKQMETIGIFILVLPFVIGYMVGKQVGIKEARKDIEE